MKNWMSRMSKRDWFLVIGLEVVLIALLFSVGIMMTQPLRLNLIGDQEITVFCGAQFQDPGAAATLHGKEVAVTRTGTLDIQKPGTYTLTYTAKASLTSCSVQRTVKVVQVEPTTLSLLGEHTIRITIGTAFDEPGFEAVDCFGQDVTNLVQVSGNVDTDHCGEYVLTYTVTDSAGNQAKAERTVIVEPMRQPDVVPPDGKVIYLTFDDGPGAYTRQLLDVLKKYNVKATFFVIDSTKSDKADLMRAIVEEGHSIGIHSMSHNYEKIYSSDEAFIKDLKGMQNIIYKETGVMTTLMRFPGGSSNTISKHYSAGIMSRLVKQVTDLGFQYFDWNVDSDDAGSARDADTVYRNVIAGIEGKKTAVVLQHDVKGYSVEAVERIIQWGLANGYSFLGLTPSSPTSHHGVNN